MRNIVVAIALLLLFSQSSYSDGIFNGGSGGGGGSGTVTSIATGCQATGGTITTTGTISTQVTPTTLSGSNPAITTGYCGGLENLSNAGAQTPTIAEAGSAGFPAGWYTDSCNIGTGVQTLTPGGGTIGGASTLVIAAGSAAAPVCYRLVSDGVSNYDLVFPPGAGSVTASSTTTFTNKTLTSATNSLGGVTAALGSDAKGDIYTNGGSSNVLTRLGIGSTNNCLIVASGLPSWAACPGGTITAGTTATSGFSAGNIAYSDGTNIQASAATVTSGGSISSPATGTVSAPNFVGSAAGSNTGFYFPAASGQMGFTSAGSKVLDYGATTAGTFTWTGNFTFTGNTTLLAGNAANITVSGGVGAGTATLKTLNNAGAASSAGNINITGGNGTGTGASNGASIVLTPGSSTNGTAGQVTLPAITSDAALTDTTVCQDTTLHALRAGSGTAGICLGNVSSIRFKHEWQNISDGLAIMNGLDPSTYRYNEGIADGGTQLRVGFSAERYADILPQFTRYDSEGRPNGLDMLAAFPYAVRAIQQLDEMKADKDVVAELKEVVARQQIEIEDLKRRVH